MTDRTLTDHPASSLRSPSFEMQQAAIQAGYQNVRDWVLDQCIVEIRELKGRVDALEGVEGEVDA